MFIGKHLVYLKKMSVPFSLLLNKVHIYLNNAFIGWLEWRFARANVLEVMKDSSKMLVGILTVLSGLL